eukprot:TRINITY_DN13535_c0_g2_i1.p1 TRINITY_DN13535_c0_g2~~TRINITY_DN13535_c0_g2_i1.p1  ORF type:complete len:294 (-),score=40.62 TRINITY_DN13535_c0_g2_i1:184-1065(-)
MVVESLGYLNVASLWRSSSRRVQEELNGRKMSKIIHEGWMVRYGRRKIGRSFIHKRYFVLESRVLAYYKRKPRENEVPIKSLLIDGNCRVEDRGLETHHGHVVYVLSIYNKKDKSHRITMAAFNINDALLWKEKIEFVIDQHHNSVEESGTRFCNSVEYKSTVENDRTASSSDRESLVSVQDDYDNASLMTRRTTIGNELAISNAGPPEAIIDWTRELDPRNSQQSNLDQGFSRKHWHLVQCQNGLRTFEELFDTDYMAKSCRAMKAVGVVDATCKAIFKLIIGGIVVLIMEV